MQKHSTFLIAISCAVLSSCGGETGAGDVAGLAATNDPLVARTLNDPLMVDPDLAHRNEANAALTIRHDHALPPHMSTSESAEAAREAGRRELLESGPIADMPEASPGLEGEALALGMTASDIVAATGAPSRCAGSLEEGLAWAARMPDPARVMPHGMSMQAAGAASAQCNLRIVRYVTPAKLEDALSYHLNRALQSQMRVTRHKEPEDILDASRGSEHLKVYARPGPGGTTAVDLIYWKR